MQGQAYGNAVFIGNSGITYAQLPVRRGDKGDAVLLLQTALHSLGYDLGTHGADSDFGPDTQAALTKFQRNYGLNATGILDRYTYQNIEAALRDGYNTGTLVTTPATKKPLKAATTRVVAQVQDIFKPLTDAFTTKDAAHQPLTVRTEKEALAAQDDEPTWKTVLPLALIGTASVVAVGALTYALWPRRR